VLFLGLFATLSKMTFMLNVILLSVANMLNVEAPENVMVKHSSLPHQNAPQKNAQKSCARLLKILLL
jgi:hypothetical protein